MPAVGIPIVARITDNAKRLETARIAAGIVSASHATTMTGQLPTVGLGLISVQENDSTAVNENYALLKPYAGTLVFTFISADRVLGLLVQTMNKSDQAAKHFDDALAFCRNAGYRPELAWTCCDYADMLLERNGEGDRAKAYALLDESLAISTELGMRPLMERVLSRREILGA